MSLVREAQCCLVVWKDLELFTHPIVHASQMRILPKPDRLAPVYISSPSVLGLWDRGERPEIKVACAAVFHSSVVCYLSSTCA